MNILWQKKNYCIDKKRKRKRCLEMKNENEKKNSKKLHKIGYNGKTPLNRL